MIDYKQKAKNEAIARQVTNENRAFLLNKAQVLGVGLVHVFDERFAKGGMTIAFKARSPYKGGVMVEVAVATCSAEDSFSKAIGTKLALEAFFNGATIDLPILKIWDKENLSYAVKQAFTAFYEAL